MGDRMPLIELKEMIQSIRTLHGVVVKGNDPVASS